MALSIKNHQTEELAREVAKLTGKNLTEAIRAALAEKYERLRRERTGRLLEAELNEVALRCARRPVVSDLSDDQILGYDQAGIPTQ